MRRRIFITLLVSATLGLSSGSVMKASAFPFEEGDGTYKIVPVMSADECTALCKADNKCRGAVTYQPDTRKPDAFCRLNDGLSATSPFEPADLERLNSDAPAVVAERCPAYQSVYAARGYQMLPRIDRVYVNAAARRDLGWAPQWSFTSALEQLAEGESILSPLAAVIGRKGYHDRTFSDGPFPVED